MHFQAGTPFIQSLRQGSNWGIVLEQDTWEWSLVELAQDALRPSPRDFAGMVDLPRGRLLLFGGLDVAEKRLDDTWIFDTVTCAPTQSPMLVPPSLRGSLWCHSGLCPVGPLGLRCRLWCRDGFSCSAKSAPYTRVHACRSTWTEVKPDRHRPKARYAHSLARMDSRVFLFGGESNTGGADGLLRALHTATHPG